MHEARAWHIHGRLILKDQDYNNWQRTKKKCGALKQRMNLKLAFESNCLEIYPCSVCTGIQYTGIQSAKTTYGYTLNVDIVASAFDSSTKIPSTSTDCIPINTTWNYPACNPLLRTAAGKTLYSRFFLTCRGGHTCCVAHHQRHLSVKN